MTTLFDDAFQRKLEYLYIVSRKVFAGRLRAERRGKKIGSGLEFADHRDYARGDDPRYLDWNVVGRLDRLLVRLFEEEEDLYIYLLVDVSPSMAVGSPMPPFDYARQVAAALAYIGLANLDRVSLVPFAAAALPALGPTRGKGQIHKVFRFLEALSPAGVTDIAAALADFVARTRHRGLAVLVSDLFDPAGFETGLKRLMNAGFEPFVLHTHLPFGDGSQGGLSGEVRLVDAETGRARAATVTPATLRRYRAGFTRFQETLARYCLSHGVGFVSSRVDVPFERAILEVFRRGGFLA